ncbi:hypothetical protein KJ693_08865 [bacterium]|nr:hypothetical protein [bacterium]MBU1615410.1 hypothetical protein [bacterium]
MPAIKETVISLVKKLPENSTLEDIMEHLYVQQKILKGQKQLETGQFYTHEEAKEIMKEWLK